MDRIGNQLSAILPRPTSNALSAQSAARTDLCSELQAAKAATAIFGSCRRNDADDPALFTAAYKRILMGYPADVVLATADPATGIVREHVWVPAPAELVAHLERRMAPRREAEARAHRFAESEALLEKLDGATPEERARMAAHWERERAAIEGKATAEEERRAAEERLREMQRRAARGVFEPVTISPGLAEKLAAMRAEPRHEAGAAA